MKRRTIIMAVVLLLAFMPAAAFADDSPADDVLSAEELTEDTTTMEDEQEIVQEGENPNTPAEMPENIDDQITDDEVFEIFPATPEEGDQYREPESQASDKDSGPEPLYDTAASRVRSAIDEKKEYVHLSDLKISSVEMLEASLLKNGALNDTIEGYDVLEESGIIAAIVINFREEDNTVAKPADSNAVSIETTVTDDGEADTAAVETYDDSEEKSTPTKSDPVPDGKDDLTFFVTFLVTGLLGLMKMIGGAI